MPAPHTPVARRGPGRILLVAALAIAAVAGGMSLSGQSTDSTPPSADTAGRSWSIVVQQDDIAMITGRSWS